MSLLNRFTDAGQFFRLILNQLRLIKQLDRCAVIWASGLFATARILQLTTLFLPLKVLIILASDQMPIYFNYLLNFLSRDQILIMLILFIPAIFVFYIAFNIIAGKLFDKSKANLLKNKAVSLSLGSPLTRTAEYHQRLYLGLTEFILVFASIFIIFLIHLSLAVFMLFLLTCNYLVFEYLNERYPSDRRLPFFDMHRDQFIEYAVAINFLFVFFGLVVAVWLLGLDVFTAVLGLLFSRMTLQALQRMVKHTYLLKAIYAQGQEQGAGASSGKA